MIPPVPSALYISAFRWGDGNTGGIVNQNQVYPTIESSVRQSESVESHFSYLSSNISYFSFIPLHEADNAAEALTTGVWLLLFFTIDLSLTD